MNIESYEQDSSPSVEDVEQCFLDEMDNKEEKGRTITITKEIYDRINNQFITVDFETTARNFLYKFLLAYPDQRDTYVLADDISIDPDTLSYLERFGISTSNTVMESDRDYVVVFNSEEIMDVKTSLNNYMRRFIPRGCLPSYFALSTTLKDLKQYNYILEEINDNIAEYAKMTLNPIRYAEWKANSSTVGSLALHSNLFKVKNIEDSYREQLSEYEDDRFVKLDITNYVTNFAKKFDCENNLATPQMFKEICEIIDTKAKTVKEPGKRVLLYTTTTTSCYHAFSLAMKYFYGYDTFVLESSDSTYTRDYISLLYDVDEMFLDQQLRYIDHLPSLMFYRGTMVDYLMVVDKPDYTVELIGIPYVTDEIDIQDEQYIENVQDELKVELRNSELKYHKLLDIVNLRDYKNPKIKSEMDTLSLAYRKLERIVGSPALICSIHNTMFIDYDGILYLCYLNNIKFNSTCLHVPLEPKVPVTRAVLEKKMLSKMCPLELIDNPECLNYAIGFIKQSNLKAKEQNKPVLAIRGNFKHRDVLKQATIEDLVMRFCRVNSQGVILKYSEEHFVELGLHDPRCVRFRNGILSDILVLFKKEKLNDFFGVFGGHHPLLENVLRISEDVLR